MKYQLSLWIGSVPLGPVTLETAPANHPVIVEGNCLNSPTASATGNRAVGGACGDFDGHGLISCAEDADSDNIFGTNRRFASRALA